MTDYLVLAVSSDVFVSDKGESFDCRYIVAKRSDNVKPMVFKCTESVLNEGSKLINKHCNFSFDEKGRVNGIAEVKQP